MLENETDLRGDRKQRLDQSCCCFGFCGWEVSYLECLLAGVPGCHEVVTHPYEPVRVTISEEKVSGLMILCDFMEISQ